MSWIPLIIICYSPFSSDVYLVKNIPYRLSFQRVYSVGDCLCCYIRLITCMCVSCFIHVWLLTYWVCALWMLHRLMCSLLQVFLNCKYNFNSYMFDLWPSRRYLRMFRIIQYVVCMLLVINGSFLDLCVPTIQFSINVGLYMICL